MLNIFPNFLSSFSVEKVLPQSLSHDDASNRTYVSDMGNNMIHLFQDFEYIGAWWV